MPDVDAINAALATITGEPVAAPPAVEAPEVPVQGEPPTNGAAEPVPAPAPVVEAKPAVIEDEDARIDRKLQERARFEGLNRKLSERATTFEKKNAELEAKLREIEQREALAMKNLPAYLRARGIKPEQFNDVAADIVADGLGDEAPVQLRDRALRTRGNREIDERFAQMQADLKKAQDDNRALLIEVRTGKYKESLEKQIPSIPDSCEYVKAYAKRDPGLVAQAMLELAQNLAANSPEDEDDDGKPPTIAKLAELLEIGFKEQAEGTWGETVAEVRSRKQQAAPAASTAIIAGQKASGASSKVIEARNHTAPRPEPTTDAERVDQLIKDLEAGTL